MSTADSGRDSSIDNGDGLIWDTLSEVTHTEIVAGCGCAICQGLRDAATGEKTGGGPDEANPEGNNIGELLTITTNPDGSRSFSGNRNVDATLIGSKWGTLALTYSFPTSGSNYNGSTPLTPGVDGYHITAGSLQQAAARNAFVQIAAATNLTFTEITETDTNHANIRISQTADQEVGSAYGGFPSDTLDAAGDIWFGRTNQPYYDLAVKGTWGYATMMHEIGHTMGLKHGHQDYTNSDLSFYFGTSPRFGSQSLTPDRDGQAWSLMTYSPTPFVGQPFAGEKRNQPQTYMQYDLAALQYLYGANYTTNATDTTYTFSQTTGEMFVNGVGQGAPSGNTIFLTVWDGGGNDTIDVSNYANGVTVDLRPGEFSTFDPSQLANTLAYQNQVGLAPGNIAMSLLFNNDTRSLIENVKGGAGNDVFVGNTANNILDGGAGSDTVVFTNTTGVTVTLNDTGADVIVNHDGETDTLRSIENIQGTSGNDTLTGNSQNNTLSGGSGGADTLVGGAGDDRLIGGGFTVTNTAVVTKAQSESNLAPETAIDLQARNAYTLIADANIFNSTTVPHATVNATATGGGVEYYRVDVVAGAAAIFDIDLSSIDTWIELVDADGNILASNDDNGSDPGSGAATNSLISYTFAAGGTYYIRIGRWTPNDGTKPEPLAEGTTYTLHVSLTSATVNTAPLVANNTSSAILDGGDGNDFLAGTIANDTISGGAGNDTASFVTAFSNSATGVTVDLNIQGTAQNTVAAGSDTLSGIENLIGSRFNDTLIGNDEANVIEGGLGNDTMTGGPGADTASYAGASAGVTVSLGQQGQAQNTGVTGVDTLTGFQNLLGSAFNDTLTGDASENIITGGAGNDVLNPGATNTGVVDLLDGGTGTDTASFAGFTTGVTATLNGQADGMAMVNGAAIASLRSIENLRGGDGADTLTGDGGANAIEGGLGDDTLAGGDGVDTLVFSGTTGVTVDLSVTAAQATGWGNDTISGFENVRTGSGADTVTGDTGDNTFFDGGGTDRYTGGEGNDTVDYSGSTTAITVNLNVTAAQNGNTGGDILSGIENVTGSAVAANTLTGGNTTSNRLTGGSLGDFIIGGGLGDTLIGGSGADGLVGDYNGTFSTTEGSADGNDTLDGGAGNDTLVGGLGNDTLLGGSGDDILVGGLGTVSGASLTAAFTNDGGDDTYDGGEGFDSAYAYYTGRAGAISFDLGNLAGNSAITVGGVAAGSFTSVERVLFRGGLGNDTVRGGGSADQLIGNEGDDTLDGWLGNDTLVGGAGNDTLIGGEGLDTANYSLATAGVNVDLRITGAQDTGGEGIDTLVGIEYLTGSAFGDTLRGNDDFNLIIDSAVAATTGGTQSDALYGYGGNDSILVTRAATAVATTVLMDGGDGNDLIQLVSGGAPTTTADPNGLSSGASYAQPGTSSPNRFLDTVTVNAGSGNDRVVLTGVATAAVDLGTGNDLLSISTLGAAGVNAHTITTGEGMDVIQLAGVGVAATTTERANVVTDFTAGDLGDRLELRAFSGNSFLTGSWVNPTNFTGLTSASQDLFDSGHLRLVQSGTDLLFQVDRDGTGTASGFVTVMTLTGAYTGGFTTFNFDGMIGALNLTGQGDLNETLVGAIKNDTLSGGNGDDLLVGLEGNDTLDGGNGNDVLRGGIGTNTLTGGDGVDTADYSFTPGSVTVSLAVTGEQNTGQSLDTLSGIENLIGAAFNDTLTGNAGANTLDGAGGDDTLDGGEGDDLLHGGIGDDTMIGGAGFDTAIYSDAASAVTIDLSLTGVQATRGAGNDTLLGIEGLIGSVYDDVLTGGAGANRIDGDAGNDLIGGGAGDDVLIGGAGSDTLNYANLTEAVTVNLLGGTVNAGVEGGNDQISGFENVLLGAGADLFLGDAGGNRADGGAGDDQLFGNAGDDLLFGGEGSDQLFGGIGNDLLDGGAGVDFLSGGAGDDTYVVDSADDQISEFGGSGTDTVRSSISYVLASGFENLTLTGTAAINGTGNEAANIIIGNAGSNTLLGLAGDDTIVTVAGLAAVKPDAGFDRVDGGSGNDTLLLGGFQSDYRLLAAGDRTYLVTTRGATEVTGIELVGFNNAGPQAFSGVLASTAAFDGLAYIASYSDLRATFGNDAAAGESHFLRFGFNEGRGVTFNALDYIASYADLRAAFGTDTAAATVHYVYFGADQEARAVTFDGWAYLASYSDLIETFGPNKDAATSHYIRFGANEGRTITFDAAAYAAANPDLAAAFGNDAEALARHYVQFGYAEGRSLGTPAADPVPSAVEAPAIGDSGVPAGAFVSESDVATHDAVLFTGKGEFTHVDILHNNPVYVIA